MVHAVRMRCAYLQRVLATWQGWSAATRLERELQEQSHAHDREREELEMHHADDLSSLELQYADRLCALEIRAEEEQARLASRQQQDLCALESRARRQQDGHLAQLQAFVGGVQDQHDAQAFGSAFKEWALTAAKQARQREIAWADQRAS